MGRKAVDLDPELAEGHKALGLTYLVEAKYRESLDADKRAIELNPGHATAIFNLGAVLEFLGKFDEALRWYKQAVQLDPANPILAQGVGSIYDSLGASSEAERWLKRSLELRPDLGQAHARLIMLYLRHRRDEEALQHTRDALSRLPLDPWVLNAAASAELEAGDLPSAQKLFAEVLPIYRGTRGYRDGGPGVETHLAYLLLRAGKPGEAGTLLDESLATDRRLADGGNQDWSVPYDTACVHALRGEKDEAFRWLDRAVAAGWRGWPLGTRDPLLDPLRDDPRFHQLENRLQTMVRQMRQRAGLS